VDEHIDMFHDGRAIPFLTRSRIAQEANDNPSIDVVGLRKMYDWVEKDAGKTVLMTGIQTVGEKSWE
jgi:hypothetical protein